MLLWSLLAAFFLQTAPVKPIVVVGLVDGQQLAVESPQFNGFIESRDSGEPVLLYRQKEFRGEMNISAIQRIDILRQDGSAFLLTVCLRNGQRITVDSDRRPFVIVQGVTDTGTVTINHPNPIYPALRIRTRPANRKHDLTIRYLEFPG